MSKIWLNAAIIGAVAAYLQKIRESNLSHVTSERQKWREKLRDKIPLFLAECNLSEEKKEEKIKKLKSKKRTKKEIVELSLLRNNNYLTIDGIDKSSEAIATLNYMLLAINPTDERDKELRIQINKLLDFEIINRKKFVKDMAILLKTEWEKGKREAAYPKEITYLFGFLLIFSSVYMIYSIIIYDYGIIEKVIKFILSLLNILLVYLNMKEQKDENNKVDVKKLIFYLVILSLNIIFLSKNMEEENNKKEPKIKIMEVSIDNDKKQEKIELNKKEEQYLVLFEFSKNELTTSGEKILKNIENNLKEDEYIILEGGSDSVGETELNINLRNKRVEAVKKKLVELGITPEKIEKKKTSIKNNLIITGKEIKEPLNRNVIIKIKKQES